MKHFLFFSPAIFVPLQSITMFFVRRKLKRQRERICHFKFNQTLSQECIQLNSSWYGVDDFRWNSDEYPELMTGFFLSNISNNTSPLNSTSFLGNKNVLQFNCTFTAQNFFLFYFHILFNYETFSLQWFISFHQPLTVLFYFHLYLTFFLLCHRSSLNAHLFILITPLQTNVFNLFCLMYL